MMNIGDNKKAENPGDLENDYAGKHILAKNLLLIATITASAYVLVFSPSDNPCIRLIAFGALMFIFGMSYAEEKHSKITKFIENING